MSKKNKKKVVHTHEHEQSTAEKHVEKKSTRSNKRWLFIIAASVIVVLIAITIPLIAWSYDSYYVNKINYGVHIAGINVGGLTEKEAQQLLDEKIQTIKDNGFTVTHKSRSVTLYPEFTPLSPDFNPSAAENIIDFDTNKTIHDAYMLGRITPRPFSYPEKLSIAIAKPNIEPSYTINSDALHEALKNEFGTFEIPAQDASLIYNEMSGQFTIQSESNGQEFDYDQITSELSRQLKSLGIPSLNIELSSTRPHITSQDALPLLAQATSIANIAPITIHVEDRKWEMSKTTLASLFSVRREEGKTPTLTLSSEKTKTWLDSEIVPAVTIPVQHPRFELKDGRVTTFQVAKNGKTIEPEETIALLNEQIMRNLSKEITLPLKEIMSEFAENPNELNVSEVVAVGESDFKGSPRNRLTNIKVGASKINGLILAPNEEFSLVKALGNIDAKAGFLPELVIKGNKTTPEYGGGLCQVATTAFRAAIYAGLPITERRNHSYRVTYYEPAGFDAAIYDPQPNLRFVNDTGNYLLIQARIEGTKLFVELWGKKDGRSVEVDKPTVYNIKPAGPTKMIETTDLKPGEKKCTEKAHAGADAIFERRITYANGEEKKDTYKSHYVIWPGVCLVGVATLTPPTSADTVALPQETPPPSETPTVEAATPPPPLTITTP